MRSHSLVLLAFAFSLLTSTTAAAGSASKPWPHVDVAGLGLGFEQALAIDFDLVVEARDAILHHRVNATSTTLASVVQGMPTSTGPAMAVRHQLPRQIPGHYAWVERDTRAFWYSAGAGAVTTLGAHVLVGLPTLAISASALTLALSQPAVVAVMAGLFMTYTVAEAALSALVATLIFDQMSETYESHFLTGFIAHAGAGVAATAVSSLTIGGGLLLFHGLGILSEFTGSAGLQALTIFSFLGAMPAVVLAGTALVAIPALATSWALSAGATPRAGYAVDDNWLSPVARAEDPSRRRDVATGGVAFVLP